METFYSYLITFAVGGFICLLAQILVIRTKMTSSRILVLFVVIGAFLEGIQVFKYLENFAGAGARVPIIGFGATLVRGALQGIRENGFLGMLAGPLSATAIGITVAVLGAYLFALIFKSRTKNQR